MKLYKNIFYTRFNKDYVCSSLWFVTWYIFVSFFGFLFSIFYHHFILFYLGGGIYSSVITLLFVFVLLFATFVGTLYYPNRCISNRTFVCTCTYIRTLVYWPTIPGLFHLNRYHFKLWFSISNLTMNPFSLHNWAICRGLTLLLGSWTTVTLSWTF